MNRPWTSGEPTTGQAPLIRILIVDDHVVVRRGVADLLNHEPGLVVCGESAGVTDALSEIAIRKPDVAIVDLSLGAESGLDLIATLAESCPDVRTLVLSAHDELLFAHRALKAGARGYVMKTASADELVHAVRRVASGRRYVSEPVSERILDTLSGRTTHPDLPSVDRLTNREQQVFMLVGRGLETRQIADRLSLSVKTVESHYAHIKDKLGLGTGRELVRAAVNWTEGSLGRRHE